MSATSENEIASAKPDEKGKTPLHHAMLCSGSTRKTVQDRIADMERALALRDLDVNHQDKLGYTALHYLCHHATVNSDMILSQLLLKTPNKVDVNLMDSEGRTVLQLVLVAPYYSPKETQAALIQLLLKAGADVHLAIPKTGNTPLHTAAGRASTTTLMQLLLDAGADIHSTNLMGHTPLHLTKNRWNAQFLIDLSEAEALNRTDLQGNTPLHLCLFSDYGTYPDKADMAKSLIQAGADPSKPNQKGQTAEDCIQMELDSVVHDDGLGFVTDDLMKMQEFLEILLPVMQEKFPMDDQYSNANVYGKMLWRFMQEFCETETAEDDWGYIQPLLDHGATVNYLDPKSGFTTLHHLVNSCNEDGDIDSDDDEQETGQEDHTKVYSRPFGVAHMDDDELGDGEENCREYALGILNRIVEAQPEIHVGNVNQEGKNVLHYSRIVEVSKRLLEISLSERHNQQSRLDVNASDRKGRTPLHIACKQTDPHLVRLLLEHGASVLMTTKSTKDKPSGETPWEIIVDEEEEIIVDEVEIGTSLALLRDYELVQPKMLQQAHNVLEGYTGLSGQVLERLFRAGPVGRSVAFDLLPFLLASRTLACGRKLSHHGESSPFSDS